jgi:hypothetical protein
MRISHTLFEVMKRLGSGSPSLVSSSNSVNGGAKPDGALWNSVIHDRSILDSDGSARTNRSHGLRPFESKAFFAKENITSSNDSS